MIIQKQKIMKKIGLGLLALTLWSGTALYAGIGGKKKVKATKAACSKTCKSSKDCVKASCPNKPGCVCY